MGSRTNIEWTDVSWNPVRGCSRVSRGCEHCYAERQAARFAGLPSGSNAPFSGFVQIANGHPQWTGKVELIESKLEEPLHWRKPRKVFVNSMSDLFHEALSFEQIAQVFSIMVRAPQHIYQILTKRAERMLEFSQWAKSQFPGGWWPYPHIWLGVSVEDRSNKDRIEYLRETPATVRFLSIEPLLEDIGQLDLRGIHWVIAGGESGPKARPPHPGWVRSVRDQCQAAGVPFFFKQWGEWSPDAHGRFHRTSTNRYSTETFAWGKNGRYNPLDPAPDDFPLLMFKIGKKQAGRLLDGREWNEFPR